jgi:hypothetical protein
MAAVGACVLVSTISHFWPWRSRRFADFIFDGWGKCECRAKNCGFREGNGCQRGGETLCVGGGTCQKVIVVATECQWCCVWREMWMVCAGPPPAPAPHSAGVGLAHFPWVARGGQGCGGATGVKARVGSVVLFPTLENCRADLVDHR